MLKEKHDFDEESLDSILEQLGKDKSAPLQSFSDLLYQCLQAYKEEFPAPFEQHYSYTKLTELSASKMVHDDFRCLNKDLLLLLKGQDVIGSLNFQNGYFSALLVTDPYSK